MGSQADDRQEGGTERSGEQPIRLLIASAVRLFRDGIAFALRGHRCFEVAGTARAIEEAMEQLSTRATDVALVDLGMPGGLLLVREARESWPEIKVVALGVREDEQEVVACAEAGAAGFVTVDGSLDQLCDVLLGVGRGEAPCSPLMAGALLRRVAVLAERRGGAPSASLTARERQIIRLLEHDLSNKEIARELQIELPTVKNHVHNILEKLQVSRRSEVAARYRLASVESSARPRR
jgi:two-component system nitrate/nitrite response regulator NarL